MRALAALLVLGCGAKSAEPEAFDVDRCDLETMRLVAFDRTGLCADGVPREGSDLPAPIDEAIFASGDTPPLLDLEGSSQASVVALCLDAAGVVRRWGCDDDADGRLDVRLVDACVESEAACDPATPGARGWTGAGGTACVEDCSCEEPDEPPAEREWSIDVVPPAGDWDHGSTIAPDGTIHLSVFRAGEGLRHRWRVGGEWQDELVDASAVVGGSSIALDGAGAAHVAYYDIAGLKYATNASGVWRTETVDDTAGAAAYWLRTSIALHGDEVHVAYVTATVGSIDFGESYAVRRGGKWAIEEVEPRMGGGGCPAIAIDADGHAHMTYMNESSLLVHATNATGVWVYETVDAATCSNDSVLDAHGGLHVAYMAPPPAGLRYATNTNGRWESEFVDETPNAGFGTALVLGPGCTFRMLHTTYGPATMRFASGRAGAWQVEQIDEPQAAPPTLVQGTAGALFGLYARDLEGDPGPEFVIATRPGTDGLDQNCDGVDGVDADGDGHASVDTLGDDCDDADPDVHPGGVDETADGVDQDCDCRDGP